MQGYDVSWRFFIIFSPYLSFKPYCMKRSYTIVALIMLTFFCDFLSHQYYRSPESGFHSGFSFKPDIGRPLAFCFLYRIWVGLHSYGNFAGAISGKKDHDIWFCHSLCRFSYVGHMAQLSDCDNIVVYNWQRNGDVAGGNKSPVAYSRRRKELCLYVCIGATDIWRGFFF